MKHHLRLHSIRSRLFLNFIILFIITGSGLVILYSMTIKLLSNMATTSVEKMLDQVYSETSRVMSHAEQTGNMIANDAAIQSILRNPLPPEEMQVYKQRLEFNNKLFYTNQYQDSISGVYIIGDNGAIFRSTMTSLLKNDYRQESWYLDTMKTKKPIWLTSQEGSLVTATLKEPYASIVIPIHDRMSTRQLGVLVVEMKGDIFKNIYSAGLLLKGDIFILDASNHMFLYSQELPFADQEQSPIADSIQKIAFTADENTKNLTFGNIKYLASYMILQLNSWKIVGVIPFSEIFKMTSSITHSIIIVLILFLSFILFFMLRTSHMISKPVYKMSRTMKAVEAGNFDIRMDIATEDEFGALSKSFNQMLHKIDQLTKEEVDNQKKLRKSELKALQSQINPHFLYNTLDSIGWMARLNRLDKMEEIIDALSTYFRISVSRGSEFITIKEELTHVEKYLSIQKIRYEKKLNYSIEVPEDILEYKTIKMLLQPLVENSIYHGLKEKEGPGEIKITAVSGDNIVICVEDTGIGMTKEKLDELHEMISLGKDYNPNAYGVINVHKRIRFFFGEEYGLRFESEYGKGTRVFVTIGKIKEVKP